MREGESYLLEYFGKEAGQVQIENSDIPAVREDAQRFLEGNTIEVIERAPALSDVKTLLQAGWYLVPLVNSRLLNARPGYAGHFIFIYDCDDKEIVFHDPGLPPRSAGRVSWKLFEDVWSSPRTDTRSLSAFRAG